MRFTVCEFINTGDEPLLLVPLEVITERRATIEAVSLPTDLQ